ncbi:MULTISPECIES: hypothetical protein [unclassified Microcoleus]|uniref:hypothetical protein n=1 Tax=unclassified Microcoleus TaxID=2642155 RepID=UPI002FD691E5
MSFDQAPQRLHPLPLSLQEVVCLKAQLFQRQERLAEHDCCERSPLNAVILFVRSHFP